MAGMKTYIAGERINAGDIWCISPKDGKAYRGGKASSLEIQHFIARQTIEAGEEIHVIDPTGPFWSDPAAATPLENFKAIRQTGKRLPASPELPQITPPAPRSVFEGAEIGSGLLTRAAGIARYMGTRTDNYEFRHIVKQQDGSRTYHNDEGRTPLDYDPGSYVVCGYPLPTPAPVYAERPAI